MPHETEVESMDDGALSVGTLGTYTTMNLWMDLLSVSMRMVVNHGPRSATTLVHSNYIPCPTLGFYFLHTMTSQQTQELRNHERSIMSLSPEQPLHVGSDESNDPLVSIISRGV